MIVDSHVAVDRNRYPLDRAISVLARSNVTRAVVFMDARAHDMEGQNQYILDACRGHDFFPFYYVGGNPWTDSRPDELVVPDNLSDYAGIRWHRWVGEGIDRQGELDRDELSWAANLMESSEFEALVAAAAYYSMPVIFEESLAVTLEFVQRFPSLDIIVPHLGAQSGGQTNALRSFWDQPNVYFDTSLSLVDEVTLARVGSERILFGSGYPQGDPEAEVDKVEQLPIPDEAKEGIFGENVVTLLEKYEQRTS